jgi:hypothetical protein
VPIGVGTPRRFTIDSATWDAVQAQLAANHHENRTRTNAKSKSLLAGLIYDDAGNRLASSHATKNGRRYRYYVTTQGAGRTAATPGSVRLRLPATVIDELVQTRLQNFLKDKAEMSLLLRKARYQPAQIGVGLNIATELANSLTSELPTAQRAAELIARVTASHRKPKDLHQARPFAGDINRQNRRAVPERRSR